MIERIASPNRTKEILNENKFLFQKKFGQNFLIDLHVLDKIIDSAEITKDDVVLEIGPGIGSLTQLIAERAKKVYAVEIDAKLIPILKKTLSPYENVTLIHNDILKVDLKKLCDEIGQKIKIVANLPYYITTPIVMGIFEQKLPVDSMTVMVQKEVAMRMQAKPKNKDYGALSLAVQYYSSPYIVANVPPNCFIPRPKVGSAVIRLKKYDKPQISVENEGKLFSIIKGAFGQRRKTLVNALSNAQGLDLTKEDIIKVLEDMELDYRIRGEALSLEQFARLSESLC